MKREFPTDFPALSKYNAIMDRGDVHGDDLPASGESAITESGVCESASALATAPAAHLPRPLLALAVFLLFLAGVIWFVRTRPPARLAGVVSDAVWIDGVWISCRAGGSATEWECLVFSDNGALLHSGIYRGLIGTASQPHIINYGDGRLGTLEGVFLQEIPPKPAALAGADTSAWPPKLWHGVWDGDCILSDTTPFHLTDNDNATDTVTPTDTIVIATTPLPDGVDTAALLALLALIPTAEEWATTGETELPGGSIESSCRGYQLSDFNIPERYHQLPETFERRAREEAIVIVLLTTIDTSTVLARVCTPESRDSSHTDRVVFRKEGESWRAYGAGSIITFMIRCNG